MLYLSSTSCFFSHGRDGGCDGGEDNHETEDIDVLADESREVLELWKISKQRKISQLTEQVSNLIPVNYLLIIHVDTGGREHLDEGYIVGNLFDQELALTLHM